MNFFKNFLKNTFKTPAKVQVKESEVKDDLSLDQKFVQNFIRKGGKFLYCSDLDETQTNFSQILDENEWKDIVCFDDKLDQLLNGVKSNRIQNINLESPFFTSCESLIAHDGSIMFSSKQLQDKKLNVFPNNFIVFAKTSQISQDTREGISGIRNRSKKNSATIISSIKDYLPQKGETDFMSYGNTNSKTLYLLLLEDL